MSSPLSKSNLFDDFLATPTSAFAANASAMPLGDSADRAIDAALKSVPLPDGLLSRLGLMVSTMSDDVSDAVDYLGC